MRTLTWILIAAFALILLGLLAWNPAIPLLFYGAQLFSISIPVAMILGAVIGGLIGFLIGATRRRASRRDTVVPPAAPPQA